MVKNCFLQKKCLVNSLKRPSPPNSKPLQVVKRILSACGKLSPQSIKPRQLVNWLKWLPPNDIWFRYLVNSLKIPSPPNSQNCQLVRIVKLVN